MSESRASKRRGLMSKIWRLFKRPMTFKMASFMLNVINLVVRAIDHFK
jgi:hypothetical protein